MTSWRFWAKTTPDGEPGISVRSQLRESLTSGTGENWHESLSGYPLFTTRLCLSSTAACATRDGFAFTAGGLRSNST